MRFLELLLANRYGTKMLYRNQDRSSRCPCGSEEKRRSVGCSTLRGARALQKVEWLGISALRAILTESAGASYTYAGFGFVAPRSKGRNERLVGSRFPLARRFCLFATVEGKRRKQRWNEKGPPVEGGPEV
jgi:hypothetical protein